MKLYRVTLRGLQHAIVFNGCHGVFYAVAENSDAAYMVGKNELEKSSIGVRSERELFSIELIAEEGKYPDCGTTLYVSAK